MMVVTAVVVFASTSGTGGSLDLWGRSYDDMTGPAIRTTHLAPVVVVLGEVLLFLWHRMRRGGELSGNTEEIAAVFGDEPPS